MRQPTDPTAEQAELIALAHQRLRTVVQDLDGDTTVGRILHRLADPGDRELLTVSAFSSAL